MKQHHNFSYNINVSLYNGIKVERDILPSLYDATGEALAGAVRIKAGLELITAIKVAGNFTVSV